jgi:hypothetical protein
MPLGSIDNYPQREILRTILVNYTSPPPISYWPLSTRLVSRVDTLPALYYTEFRPRLAIAAYDHENKTAQVHLKTLFRYPDPLVIYTEATQGVHNQAKNFRLSVYSPALTPNKDQASADLSYALQQPGQPFRLSLTPVPSGYFLYAFTGQPPEHKRLYPKRLILQSDTGLYFDLATDPK